MPLHRMQVLCRARGYRHVVSWNYASDQNVDVKSQKKSVTDFTRLQTLVAPPRFELSQTEPKPGVLPLHHGAISFLRAQR